MADLDTDNYYIAREKRERELAAAAASATVSAIHLELAKRYCAMVYRPEALPKPLAGAPASNGPVSLQDRPQIARHA